MIDGHSGTERIPRDTIEPHLSQRAIRGSNLRDRRCSVRPVVGTCYAKRQLIITDGRDRSPGNSHGKRVLHHTSPEVSISLPGRPFRRPTSTSVTCPRADFSDSGLPRCKQGVVVLTYAEQCPSRWLGRGGDISKQFRSDAQAAHDRRRRSHCRKKSTLIDQTPGSNLGFFDQYPGYFPKVAAGIETATTIDGHLLQRIKGAFTSRDHRNCYAFGPQRGSIESQIIDHTGRSESVCEQNNVFQRRFRQSQFVGRGPKRASEIR